MTTDTVVNNVVRSQDKCDLRLNADVQVDVVQGDLPTWNPEVEALRLRINVREQTVIADTVAHDFGDDVDSYNHKVHKQNYSGDVDEYRVMCWEHDTDWVERFYVGKTFRKEIADFIIAAKISNDDPYFRESFTNAGQVKKEYLKRMIEHHLDRIEVLVNDS
jgi:hypothetical protein